MWESARPLKGAANHSEAASSIDVDWNVEPGLPTRISLASSSVRGYVRLDCAHPDGVGAKVKCIREVRAEGIKRRGWRAEGCNVSLVR